MKISCSNRPCKSSDDFEIALHLFQEYAEFLGFILCFQGFDQELEILTGKYASPQGFILLARDKSVSVDCAALRPRSDDVCEMKRLDVKPEYRGAGLGRKLAEKILQLGIEKKLDQKIQLDTLSSMYRACLLYTSPSPRDLSTSRMTSSA